MKSISLLKLYLLLIFLISTASGLQTNDGQIIGTMKIFDKDLPQNSGHEISSIINNNNILGNSDKMTGNVSVAVFFVESDGSIDPNTYTWTSTDENLIIGQINSALNWWSTKAIEYGVTLNFQSTYYRGSDARCRQSYEPILHPYTDCHLWIDPIMNNFGFGVGSTLSRVKSFNSNLKSVNGSDWAFSIFVCYNPTPASSTFLDGFSNTSTLNGPYIHMLYRNDTIPVSANTDLIAYDIGIIFGALEECNNCRRDDVSKFIQNINCENNIDGSKNTTSVNCIMKNKKTGSGVCSCTAAHIGWINAPILHTITTNPAGLQITTSNTGPFGTQSNFTPVNFLWEPGLSVDINTASPQFFNSTNYTFFEWSDKKNLSHSIIISSTADTITAHFIGPPIAPGLLFPLNDSLNCSLNQVLTWNSVLYALYYRIQVSTDSLFSIIILDKNNITGNSQIVSGLLNSKYYYWRVCAFNQSGSGPWSLVRRFATKVTIPSLITPPNNSIGITISPQISWDTIASALSYELQVSTDPNFSHIVIDRNNLAIHYLTLDTLTKNVTYYWRVRAFCSLGISDWSSTWHFTTVSTTAEIIINTYYLKFDSTGYKSTDIDSIISITNASISDNLIITSIFLDSEIPIFKIYDAGPITVAPKGTVFIRITFHPDSVGTFTNNLHILNSSNNNSHFILPIYGKSSGTTLSVEPDIFNFGKVGYHANPQDTSIILKNIGNFPLKFDSIILNNPGRCFEIDSVSPSPVNLLYPNGICKIFLKINPKVLGTNSDTLIISNNSSNRPLVKIPLQINILLSNLLFSRDSLLFDSTCLQIPERIECLLMNNNGLNPINLIKNIITGDTNSFIIYKINKSILFSGETDSLFIKFRPRTGGLKTAVLNILSDDPLLSHKNIFLFGSAGGRPIFNYIQNLIDFGNIPIGESCEKYFYYKNTGNLDLNILNQSITGTDKDIFSIISNLTIPTPPQMQDSIKLLVRSSLPLGGKKAVYEISTNENSQSRYKFDVKANIISPCLGKSIDRIDFNEIEINRSADTCFELKNSGNSTLKIYNLFIDGPYAGNFHLITDSTTFDLSINTAKLIKVAFTPLVIQEYAARVAIKSNDPFYPEASIILSGKGTKQLKSPISFSCSNLDFGLLDFNTNKDSSITIYNLSTVEVKIDSIYLIGEDRKYFQILNIWSPIILKPLDSKKIMIRFSPNYNDTLTSFYSKIRFVFNDTSISYSEIKLSGSIFRGFFTVSDTLLNFGNVIITDSAEKSISISNPSRGFLKIDSIYFDYLSDQPFSIKPIVTPVILEPNQDIKINIIFKPKNKKHYSGNIYIFSNSNPENNRKIKLEGNAITPKMELPGSIDFGKIRTDSAKFKELIVFNSGEAPLIINSIYILGKDSADFAISHINVPFNISPSNTDSFTVTFLARNPGPKSALIKISSNDPFSSNEINLGGEAIDKNLNICQRSDLQNALFQNYPNPFNPSTRIEFSIPQNTFVTIKIFNYLGQEIKTLVEENKTPGIYLITWEPGKLPSGLYYIQMITPKYREIKKMIFMR